MKLLFSIVLLIGCVIDNYATNRALLIGIGKYPTSKTEWKQIHGDADVKLLAPALKILIMNNRILILLLVY